MKIIRDNLFLILILFAAGFIVYSFNLNNPLFWDDTDWIVNNPFVHNFSLESVKNWFTKNTLAGIGLKSNYYRPFLFFTFTSNYVLHGISPLGYHLINNLLHIANGILIFILLFSVFRKKFIAFWAALLFLIHPLQTEAITYIAGRGDPLVVLFMLLALWLFIKSESTTSQVIDQRHRMSLKGLSLLFLILALLSRETAIIFPFLLIVFFISFISPYPFLTSFKKSIVKSLPYFVIIFIYGILRLTVLNFQNTLNFYSQPNAYSESLFVRMLTFLGVLGEYTKLIFAPVGLHMEREVIVYTSLFHARVLAPFLIIVFLLGLLVYLYKKENSKHETRALNKLSARPSTYHVSALVRNPKPRTIASGELRGRQIQNSKFQTVSNFDIRISSFRIWLFGLGWFFINLGPTSGITPINAVMYEHWLYLALVGPFIILSFYLNKLWEKYSDKKIIRFLVIAFLIFLAGFFSFLSVKRNILWGNPIAFFEDILKYEPSSVRINNNIGNLYYDKEDYKKAEEYYWKAISVEDIFPQPHYNLGAILHSRNDFFGAITEYEKAIEIDPYFHYAYEGLASIYANQGELPKAAEYIEKLKQIVPNNPRVYYNAALIYIARNDKESAIKNLEQGLKYTTFDSEGGKKIKELLIKLRGASGNSL